MDKTEQYKSIVRDIVKSIANMTPNDEFSETQTVMDDERGHYLLLDIGWQQKKRAYLPFVHIDVKQDGKVWIQHDGTDLIIAEMLVKQGIPKSQIVLGYRSPAVRPLIDDYAPA